MSHEDFPAAAPARDGALRFRSCYDPARRDASGLRVMLLTRTLRAIKWFIPEQNRSAPKINFKYYN